VSVAENAAAELLVRAERTRRQFEVVEDALAEVGLPR
jgi:hypothetical protein